MKEKVTINGIRKSFGDKKVLQGVSLKLHEGEILCLMGGSGSGKSVMMKHLMGIMRPDSGEIMIDGRNFTAAEGREREEMIRGFGILFQGAALFDSMNIFDNVAFGLRRKKYPEDEIKKIVPDLLSKVGLRGVEDKMPSELSGGMQKRAGLARSLAVRPGVMLYDEPTTGVDPITAGAVERLIVKMKKDLGLASIVVTHDIKSALKIADRIAMLWEGKIIFDDTPARILETEDAYIKKFTGGAGFGRKN